MFVSFEKLNAKQGAKDTTAAITQGVPQLTSYQK